MNCCFFDFLAFLFRWALPSVSGLVVCVFCLHLIYRLLIAMLKGKKLINTNGVFRAYCTMSFCEYYFLNNFVAGPDLFLVQKQEFPASHHVTCREKLYYLAAKTACLLLTFSLLLFLHSFQRSLNKFF